MHTDGPQSGFEPAQLCGGLCCFSTRLTKQSCYVWALYRPLLFLICHVFLLDEEEEELCPRHTSGHEVIPPPFLRSPNHFPSSSFLSETHRPDQKGSTTNNTNQGSFSFCYFHLCLAGVTSMSVQERGHVWGSKTKVIQILSLG